ncbi:CHAT domain-containing protein [Lactarius quietus]|nr:CHAT domain-containing protein [Lactarius quietus]
MGDLPQDSTDAAKYFRSLPDQPWVLRRRQVTTARVVALASQVMLEARDVMPNIREMADLCRDLLTSDLSKKPTTLTLLVTLTCKVVFSKIRMGVSDQPLDQVIECLRVASLKANKPELREAHFALAHCLTIRYDMTNANDDYEEAASILDEIIGSSFSGDSQDKFVARAQQMMVGLAMLRSLMNQTPGYSEESIYRALAFLNSSPEEHPLYPRLNHHALEVAERERFRYFGFIEGSEPSSSNSPSFRKNHPEFGPIIKKTELLRELLSRIRNNDITKIDEAIKEGRIILASSASSAASRDLLTPWHRVSFGDILIAAYMHTRKIEYLNESISTYRQVLDQPSPQFLRLLTLKQRLFELARSIPVRGPYESALSLMQDTPFFAPTLQLQHATLARMSDVFHGIPLDYASYQVDLGQLEEAIETLERGRALIWSEMRHLRTSVDQLLEADPQLGHKFAVINGNLEQLTKSRIPPSHELSMDGGGSEDLRAMDPFGCLWLKQSSLLKERNKLISRIQVLPGFNNFLRSPSFDQLRSAASSGPVIIINHSRWRSDILILLHNAPPSLIPTLHDFYDRSSALKDTLTESRHNDGLDSSQYDQTLAFVLSELYILVGKPVINRLSQLQVPEQSRIWWCPTSVFCSLPLHAMGPIPSDDGEIRYFLDLYICSYTPTLSALIQSRNRDGSQFSNRPSLLLVAQPDPTLPTVGGEIQVVQALKTEVNSLLSEAATPAAVIDGFRHHQFVHFACHGTLEEGKPFEAGFKLHRGERLKLLEIVRSDLPTAEFAFLSACHTAEITKGSLADEGLHLAAAVQYCGFRSVVGTMWAMVDEDGQELAEISYKALFSNSKREHGTPYHERSAKALRFAVKKLRRKRWITLERWVNFVHYGA